MERRSHRRIPVRLPVNVNLPATHESVPALLMDLSEAGLYLKGAITMELGAVVDVRFQCREPVGWCAAAGRVVRVNSVSRMRGVALQFDDVNDAFAVLAKELGSLDSEDWPGYLVEVMSPSIEVAIRPKAGSRAAPT